jgi:hypothetical protein
MKTTVIASVKSSKFRLLLAICLLFLCESFAENKAPSSASSLESPSLTDKSDIKAGFNQGEDQSEEQGEQVVDLYKSMPQKAPQETLSVSGIVVGIRSNPETEVFLKNAKSSVIIPKGRRHNEFLNKAIQSQKSGREIGFIIDAKTMRIVEDAANKASEKPSQ